MQTIKEYAYAKINLGLDIIGKRDDGYHEVSMIMQSIALNDEVIISEGYAPNTITIETDVENLSCGNDNLAYKAAALLAAHCQIIPNVHIFLRKKIFLAAGLAGGSSDAAAVLRGLNRFWQLNLETFELEHLAAMLGSDVPFCIEGGTMLATGRGEVLTKLGDLPESIVVIAKPKNLEVSTAWVYQNYNKGRVVHAPCIWQIQEHLSKGISAIMPHMGNVLETVTIPAHPVIASIKATMLSKGADFALMSGSGPTVFAFAQNKTIAENIATALADFDVETIITTTIGRIK